MFDTKEQLEEYIEKIFNNLELFEWDVLHVSTNTDRAEVIEILAKKFVHESLKNDINFLYITDIENIKYNKIKQAMFKEIVGEWVFFCDDVLSYSKDDALNAVKKEGRVNFINKIVSSYFQKFHSIIFTEMFDSFLELFNNMPITKNKQIFIDKILQSSLNRDAKSITIRKFSQLYGRVRIAQDLKNKEITKLNLRIKELMSKLHSTQDINYDEDNELLYDIEDLQEDLEDLEEKGLYEFDELIAKLRENMLESMRIASLGV
ncbi:hypothetical protein FJR48_05595 [Sulfurimonas lithotrophica]|uniref:Uncharacterized protein n=1 Tax=Sulfurimonas lithotrophica TaxID=2590022 RepID=A0A5P8P0K6_9BACT|nr:hypothetical protein [Sulfurimonas lithotrophica]QFR49229.1 hypothetical protein FJR48_05595 [Sulfurimonas lithotrophica]